MNSTTGVLKDIWQEQVEIEVLSGAQLLSSITEYHNSHLQFLVLLADHDVPLLPVVHLPIVDGGF